ncbi:MAG: hypothetical protein MAG453_00304 [Calditrichaeota bacterium]|nr:hypothetical protein [Calditrichota bacterium]
MRTTLALALAFMLAAPALARTDIRIDPDYDPRITLRVVVLPAHTGASLRRVNARTVSAMFATELLRFYEVLDLHRFEQILSEQPLSLDEAFSAEAKQAVRDNAGVDAVASVEIYRWEEGTGGLPFLGRRSGRIGAQMRMMDPYTGRIYWSVNRLEKVGPGTDFLDRATELFRDVVLELADELAERVERLNEADSYADLLAKRGQWPRLKGAPRRFDGDGSERAFIPKLTPEAAYLAAYRGYFGELPDTSATAETTGADKPRTPYEDVEKHAPEPLPRLQRTGSGGELPAAVDTSTTHAPGQAVDADTAAAGRDTASGSSGRARRAPTLPEYDYLDAPTDTTTANRSGYETAE